MVDWWSWLIGSNTMLIKAYHSHPQLQGFAYKTWTYCEFISQDSWADSWLIGHNSTLQPFFWECDWISNSFHPPKCFAIINSVCFQHQACLWQSKMGFWWAGEYSKMWWKRTQALVSEGPQFKSQLSHLGAAWPETGGPHLWSLDPSLCDCNISVSLTGWLRR